MTDKIAALFKKQADMFDAKLDLKLRMQNNH
jgi:hypothetical protein